MTILRPALVTAASAEALAVLDKGVDQDWSRAAGNTDWSCRQMLDHIVLGVVGYAGLLIAQPTNRYITLFASIDKHAPIAMCLEAVHISATMLASAVREAGPEVRASHPYGTSDGPGFAAMGALEMLVHAHDIVCTLGIDWTPSNELSVPVVDRLFPDAPAGHAPGQTLLWCTGRIALPGIAQRPREGWQWDGTVR